MTRSLPEKTFEHWCSIHLNYRYHSHLQMWWPSSGPDIDAAAIPGAFGKRIWLELKTVEWDVLRSRHYLSIQANQLDKYAGGAVPDYYVFPVPPWEGILSETTANRWLGTLSAPQLAYQKRSKAKWFAEWTFVVPGHVLRRCLAGEIAVALTKKSSDIRIATIDKGTFTWTPPALKGVSPILWKRFWEIMEACGGPDYPAQFILPGGGSGSGTPMSGPASPRSQLVASLASIALDAEPFSVDDLRLYSPDVDDNYKAAFSGGGLGEGFEWENVSRALVLIEADGLKFS